jgi:hypothetical protein
MGRVLGCRHEKVGRTGKIPVGREEQGQLRGHGRALLAVISQECFRHCSTERSLPCRRQQGASSAGFNTFVATPFFATQYTFNHLGEKALAARVSMAYYDAGHMMYIDQPSLKKLKDDIAKFMGSK